MKQKRYYEGNKGEMRKDALQCIFVAFVLQIFGVFFAHFFAQWNSQLIKILLLKVHLDIFLNISRLLCKHCYKVLNNEKAISGSHMSIQMTLCQHATQTQKIVKCCKPTHNFQEISNKPEMLQNFINILSNIPTKSVEYSIFQGIVNQLWQMKVKLVCLFKYLCHPPVESWFKHNAHMNCK